ncbi:MAG: helix-turn-helix domain-containing protein [Alphaproteobacteria bacterium]|nr:helix-turn-helix domain-containing protein [Alphaproteobacteria bacterium]
MRKSFVQAVSRRSPKTASRSQAGEDLACEASGEAALPPWVSKNEPLVSKNPKPEFGARQKKKGEETNCALAPPSQSAKLLTVAEAAWLLNLSQKTVRRMIVSGNLAVIRIGRSIRINPEVIEKIMPQNE